MVEIYAFDIGYGGILKQKLGIKEILVRFTSKVWKPPQKKYSTIKNEILVIVLIISKFQDDFFK